MGFPTLFCFRTPLLFLLDAWVPLKEEKYFSLTMQKPSHSTPCPRARTHETQGCSSLHSSFSNGEMMCPETFGNPRQITKQKWIMESVL